MKSNNLQVEVFKGVDASVNSYIFSNGQSMMVMDVLRSSSNATDLIEVLKAKNLPLTHVLISHGHPDHYTGMDVIRTAFPDVKIVVPSQEIKQDIINFSTWMTSVGWMDAEPRLKPMSAENPNGFDYEGIIEVLDSDVFELQGGGVLNIKSDYAFAEAEHLTTVYSKDLNAFFTSDFCYNGVHLWLGQGVDQKHINNWKNQLSVFKAQFVDSDVTIYPGHGESSSIALFDEVVKYIENFENVISSSSTAEDAMDAMKKLYPTWEQADFLLLNSVNYHMSLKK